MVGFGPPAVDFYSQLSGLGDTLQANRKQNNIRAALTAGADGTVDFKKALSGLAAGGDLDSAAKLAAIQKASEPETSADMQAYRLYQHQGGALPFLDFKKQLAEAGSTKITNAPVITGEKEFDKTVGKGYGERFLEAQKNGAGATGAIANLNTMDKLIDDPNFYSGSGGPVVTAFKKGAASLGIAGSDTAAPNELFGKIANKTVLDAAGGSLGTGFSNADRSFLEQTVPNIGNTKEGNKQIIGIARSVEQRKQDVARLMRDYAGKNGGRIDAGFDAVLADYAEKNHIFSNLKVGTSPASNTQSPQPRQAPDGNFYIPDPDRPGKYLKVVQ